MHTSSVAPWWSDAVIYQVYIRSFADANGDGVGDLQGVISKLPYLASLGVDALWLNPFYPSPQKDAGYDVADYRDVDSLFGSLADFDALVRQAHRYGLRVIIDLVANHTSSEHPWFAAALTAGPGSRERSRYIFRDGRGPTGDQPPNDWQSMFGGPAWTRVADGQWYLHLFAAEQPDLDWTNPQVAAEFEDILRFWLDRGVDGFRIDAAHGLAKDPALGDMPQHIDPDLPPFVAQPQHPFWDRDEVHAIYRAWRRIIDTFPGDRMTVAEAWVYQPDRLARYLQPDELHTAFNFTFLVAPWTAPELRRAINDTLTGMHSVGAPPTWVLSNHDVVREVTRYGGGSVGQRRARAAALLMLGLPGSAYIYQGQELGLEEVLDLPEEALQDPLYHRTHGAEQPRDGCRVPLPWTGSEPPFGFTSSSSTWLPQPARWVAMTVESQDQDLSSMLALYRAALGLRRKWRAINGEELRWLDTEESVLAFTRPSGFACIVNTSPEPVALPASLSSGSVVLSSEPLHADGRLPADAAAWLDLS